MTDKIVTHADLAELRYIREAATSFDQRLTVGGDTLALLDRLIAAAEADAPPLPEGWVRLDINGITERVLWHRNGKLSVYSDGGMAYGDAVLDDRRDRLTPLRPTVTEADVEKAARAARAACLGGDTWDAAHQDSRDGWKKTVRAALATLDIEVTP